jgi:hypothetical protein
MRPVCDLHLGRPAAFFEGDLQSQSKRLQADPDKIKKIFKVIPWFLRKIIIHPQKSSASILEKLKKIQTKLQKSIKQTSTRPDNKNSLSG